MNLTNMLNKRYWLILIIITAIAVFPRVIEVFNPYNYFFDPEQGVEYMVTKSIVIDHKVVLTAWQGGLGTFSKGPGFNYLLAIPFILAQGDPFGGRIFMLIISILTVPLAFIFANRMLGLRTATIISFLLAISPNLKDYAGGISPPFVIPLLTVFFIYFLFEALHGNKKFIPFLVFVVGLMTHFEMAAAEVLLVLLILTGFICLIKKTIPYRYYLLSIAAFALSIFPLIIFDLTHNFYNVKGILNMFNAGSTQTSNYMSSGIGNLFANRISVFGWNFVSTFSPNLIIWVIVLAVMLTGIFQIIKDKKLMQEKKTFVLYLALIPVFSFLSLMIYPGNTINQWWIVYLTVIYCFLLGTVLNYLWGKNKLRLLIIFVLSILSIAFFNRTLFIYRTQYVYAPATYIKEDQAIKFIFKEAKGNQFGIVVLSSRPQQNYDYLIWWNGEKYSYQPYRTPKKTYYVIIEPNLIYETNSTPGKLIMTTRLSDGFTIEKRLVN